MLSTSLVALVTPTLIVLAPSIAAAVRGTVRITLFVLAVLTQRYLKLPNADVVRLLAVTRQDETTARRSDRPKAGASPDATKDDWQRHG